MTRNGLDPKGLGKEHMASCFEHVDEHLASTECGAHQEWLKILACWEGFCFIEYIVVLLFMYIIY
jgi:hypothetical protein